MNSQEVLKICLEKGLLLDREILNLFSEINDLNSIRLILDKVTICTQRKVITREVFYENKHQISTFFFDLPKESQKNLENFKIKLGLNLEILNEAENNLDIIEDSDSDISHIKINNPINLTDKKPDISYFVKNFRNRFSEIRNILQEHQELDNLVSINKIVGDRQKLSLIGMIFSKKITKNNNILFEIEDLTGKIRVLINGNKKELYEQAEELTLDSVVGFKGSGNKEIIFANEIILPESKIAELKRAPLDELALFIGDLHFGSKLFLKKSFLKFIDYLNGNLPNTPEVNKIKYLFIVGDVVTGVGNYPNQEKDLEILDLEEQFIKLAELLGKIRKDITIIISPGNHDGVRIMEPQPCLDEKYAWPLYDLDNVILTQNPSEINIASSRNFSGFNILTYHGFSFPYYADNVSTLMKKKAMNSPEDIMKYLLKVRHLAPSYKSTQFFPFEQDALVIRNVPDIFVSAHTHKSGISLYNNILIISVSSWEGATPYQEKMGAEPDFCKVPMFNLKTREIKILDFEESGN